MISRNELSITLNTIYSMVSATNIATGIEELYGQNHSYENFLANFIK